MDYKNTVCLHHCRDHRRLPQVAACHKREPDAFWTRRTAGSRELFTLAVLAIALGIAYGSAVLFDVSFALGAFFAGVVLAETDLSHQAAENSLPLQDAFAVLFFVSVGMLFDPGVLVERPVELLGVLFVILVGKSLAAFT
jgi:CPA2 family monovalent cation:H+ antiporter-2